MTGMADKVYSEAMFQLGREDGKLDQYHEELTALAEIFRESPELAKLLSAPSVSEEEKHQVLQTLFEGRVSLETYHFLSILTDKHRITRLNGIAEEFNDQYNLMHGILEVTAVTVEPLKPALRESLTAKLAATTGKKIKLLEKRDPSILGGIVLHYGSRQVDSSVKAKLDAIYAQMKGVIA